MELSMATRKAITRALAVQYRKASKEVKGEILDTVCGLTGCHPRLRPPGPAGGTQAAGVPEQVRGVVHAAAPWSARSGAGGLNVVASDLPRGAF
jgi:hypothetical protein